MPRDIAFRGCILLSLTLLAVAFSGYREHKAYTDYCTASAHAGEQGCKAEKPFGESVFADPVVFFACVTAFFTGCLIVVGVVQAGLFWWQLGLIRDGLSDTQEATEATKEQAKLARESLIASNRAWIKVDQVEIESDLVWHPPVGSEPPRAAVPLSVLVSNIGGTPALNVNTQMEFVKGEKNVPAKIEALVSKEQSIPVAWTRMLMPGQAYRRE